jgi:hypothetical protein
MLKRVESDDGQMLRRVESDDGQMLRRVENDNDDVKKLSRGKNDDVAIVKKDETNDVDDRIPNHLKLFNSHVDGSTFEEIANISMKDEDIPEKAFLTKYGLFEFKSMPFGFCDGVTSGCPNPKCCNCEDETEMTLRCPPCQKYMKGSLFNEDVPSKERGDASKLAEGSPVWLYYLLCFGNMMCSLMMWILDAFNPIHFLRKLPNADKQAEGHPAMRSTEEEIEDDGRLWPKLLLKTACSLVLA